MINCSDFQRSNDTYDNTTLIGYNIQCIINVWKDNSLYTDDYIKLVNNHWLQFMPPNLNTYYVWGISYASIMIFGYIGNCLAIFMVFKCKPAQTSTNILVLNLCASDLILLTKAFVVIYNSYYLGPMLGNIGCQIEGFVGIFGRTVSTMTLTAISLDRYNGLVHPLKSVVKNTKNRTKIWLGIIWIYGFLLSVFPLLDMNEGYAPEGILISCNLDYLSENKGNNWFVIIFYISALFTPTFVIFFCYAKIIMTVYEYTYVSNGRMGQETMKKKTDIKFGIMVILALVMYTLNLIPNAIIAILSVLKDIYMISPLTIMITSLICEINSSINPWIYMILPNITRSRNRTY